MGILERAIEIGVLHDVIEEFVGCHSSHCKFTTQILSYSTQKGPPNGEPLIMI